MQENVTPNQQQKPKSLWKNWKVLLGIFAVLSLVITAIISVFTPQLQTVPETTFVQTSIRDTPTDFKNVTFTGSFTPNQVDYPVYQAERIDLRSTLIPKIIDFYSLVPNPESEGVWNGPVYSLSHDPGLNQYIFVKNEVTTETSAVSLDQATAVAENFLKNTLGVDFVTPFKDKAVFYENPIELTESNELRADVVKIPFAPVVAGTPLFFNKNSDYPFEIMIDSDYEVQRLIFLPYSYRTYSERIFPLIPVADAVRNINTNKGSIITALSSDGSLSILNQIVSGTLTEVTLEYRLDPESQLIYPFYRFQGTLQNNRNQEITAEVLTPAIRTN